MFKFALIKTKRHPNRPLRKKQSDLIQRYIRAIKRQLTALVATIGLIATGGAQINTDQAVIVGRNAMYFEDYVLSIQYFNQAIKAKPYLAKPYFYRAIAKLNLEDFQGAEADASKAIELNPFITDAWEVRGVARQNLGNTKDAITDYRHALELLPNNRQLMFNMALAQTSEKDYADADSTFTELLKSFPGFENGFLGRARLRLALNDTVRAMEDVDKALEINSGSFNAHTMKADLALQKGKDNFPEALEHINAAIKLQPKISGLYVNRAFIRYTLDDWFGAMDDYDYAIELDPLNRPAIFNRGLLEMEVNANDRALNDFSKILELTPDDVRSRYNRAVIYGNKRMFKEAIADLDHVIQNYPDLATLYFMRSDFQKQMNDLQGAMRDYDKAVAINNRLKARRAKSGTASEAVNPSGADSKDETAEEAPEELTKREFASLLTIDDNTDFRDEYNNSDIRGRVQDRNINIEIEPMVELSFYSAPTELKQNTYYIKEIDDLNATRSLRYRIVITNRVPTLNDEGMIENHFKSIDYYNSYLSTHTPRAIDYMGRAMDFVTVRDYPSAIRDLNSALALTPDYSPAYMLRAQARARQLESGIAGEESADKRMPQNRGVAERKLIDEIIADLDKTIELSPRNAFAWFNKGNMLVRRGDMPGAAEAYEKAYRIKPDFGEAYFNHGYVNLRLGNRDAGIADLSRAGELGVVSAYNLIKRMTATSNK